METGFDDLVRDGMVVVEDALDQAFCEEVVGRRLATMGIDDADRASWPNGWHNPPATTAFPLPAVAPCAVIGRCRDFRALTGRQGTIVLAHPFLAHSASINATDTPRVISNSSVMLGAPMRFDRPDGHFTVVERSILHHLGVDQLDYRPTGERRKVTSNRERRWAAESAEATGPAQATSSPG